MWKVELAWFILAAIFVALYGYDIVTKNRKFMTENCLEGILYIEFPNGGASVAYTTEGKVRSCTPESNFSAPQ